MKKRYFNSFVKDFWTAFCEFETENFFKFGWDCVDMILLPMLLQPKKINESTSNDKW